METGICEKQGLGLETKDFDKLVAKPSVQKKLSPCHEYQLMLCKKRDPSSAKMRCRAGKKCDKMRIIGPVLVLSPSWHFASSIFASSHKNHWRKVQRAFIHKKLSFTIQHLFPNLPFWVSYEIGIDFVGWREIDLRLSENLASSPEIRIDGWTLETARETALRPSENPSSLPAFLHKCISQTTILHFDCADFVEICLVFFVKLYSTKQCKFFSSNTFLQ